MVNMENLLKQILEGQKQLFNEVKSIRDEMATKQDLTHMEQDYGTKLSALFDAREVQFDVNERICDTLNRIEGKMDRLTLKVSSHDTRLKQVK